MSVTVHGASDDLIEIDGDISEEFGAYDSDEDGDGKLLAFSDGTVLRVKHGSVWRITPVVTGSAALAIVQCPEDDDENYSDAATLDGDVRWVVLGVAIAKSRSAVGGHGVITVNGYCPAGCGRTLMFDPTNGWVSCSASDCARPTAVTELLADSESEHVVQLSQVTFTVRHPLRERLDDGLWECELHDWIKDQPKAPHPPGRYRVVRTRPEHPWTWTRLAADDEEGTANEH